MPRHVDGLRDGDSFPVKLETNEYEALSFLVRNREYGFRPTEIADRTDISNASASKTMTRLFEKGLVERSDGIYYVEPDHVDDLKQRLDSLDAAARLFEGACTEDAYAADGWEDDMPSLDRDQNQQVSNETTSETNVEDEAEELVARLADDETGA